MILFSAAFFLINLHWQKLPQFLRKALSETRITIGQNQSCLFLLKFLKRLCLSAVMVILNIITFFAHFNLALGKSAQLIITESIRNSSDNNEFGCGVFIESIWSKR